jgi:hypothetical protein
MKILVFCPTYRTPDGLALWPASRASLEGLETGGHEVVVWISVDEDEDKTGNVVRQYRKARARALHEGFDALVCFEHDMIVPADGLIKLAGTDAGVVYGVYMFRHKKPTLNAFRAVNAPSFDQSLQKFPAELAKARAAGAWPVSGLGFGFTLIRRAVLEQVEMRKPDGGHYPDGPLANDCQRLGIRQMARFDCECGHIRPDGLVLWPFGGEDWGAMKLRCKILVTFNGGIGGRSIPFRAGDEAMIPEDEAREFARAGYLQVLEQPPAVKVIGGKERVRRVTRGVK